MIDKRLKYMFGLGLSILIIAIILNTPTFAEEFILYTILLLLAFWVMLLKK